MCLVLRLYVGFEICRPHKLHLIRNFALCKRLNHNALTSGLQRYCTSSKAVHQNESHSWTAALFCEYTVPRVIVPISGSSVQRKMQDQVGNMSPGAPTSRQALSMEKSFYLQAFVFCDPHLYPTHPSVCWSQCKFYLIGHYRN
uniref:AlNc14C530G12060 protein n=1 Tax=Albugo laibachii Nc14 TaxID=890382 RepID=F0X0W9_9STRA|nr:AlNc14C530G12060 [Albugo laibachii Nc14]|eukprot:CCA27415.1 AlNc14C530G12060 [Albugo laibachii Nc14]